MDLSNVSTKDLVEELAKREGVERLDLSDPTSCYQLEYGHDEGSSLVDREGGGPVQILIVRD